MRTSTPPDPRVPTLNNPHEPVESATTVCADTESLFGSPVRVKVESQGRVRSDIWFHDGNLVLVAGHVSFKVHRGQLERHSEVFRDIFSIPQPVDPPMEDGCPMIELFDCPTDVWYLLRALYDGLYIKRKQANDFLEITAVLRLSTKYFIEHLRERCLGCLEIDWPSTLSGWDAREFCSTDVHGRYDPRAAITHPVMVINFAREMGLTHILAPAFYDLCRYGPSKIVSGTFSIPFTGPPELVPREVARNSPWTIHIAQDDLHLVMRGREEAQRAVAQFIETELTNREVTPECHNITRDNGRVCRESFYFVMLNVLRSVGGIACGRDCDPLYTLTQSVKMLSRKDFSDGNGGALVSLRVCAACKMDFAAAVSEAREKMWSMIPGWFDLVCPTDEEKSDEDE